MGNRVQRENEVQELADRYPENSFLAPNQPLIIQSPDEDQDSIPPMTPIQTVKSQTHIHPQTIKIRQDATNNNFYYINFQFDTKTECIITAYFFATEIYIEEGKIQFSSKDPKLAPPMTFNFQSGMNQ